MSFVEGIKAAFGYVMNFIEDIKAAFGYVTELRDEFYRRHKSSLWLRDGIT
jgi:hypothetical protein